MFGRRRRSAHDLDAITRPAAAGEFGAEGDAGLLALAAEQSAEHRATVREQMMAAPAFPDGGPQGPMVFPVDGEPGVRVADIEPLSAARLAEIMARASAALGSLDNHRD